ncbi:MAG: protocatechuate 3,4-dioxygenase [Novosphingobium sp. 63-713]|uniref:class III extradiol dioxygenase family protein n=1 Tax=unclassified Novosphingobium TaxID=2644732 RepID=UPI00086B1154|nr:MULTISPECIES: class III extradiol dioxygenase family protein [unclassified Novosphingobium]MBN9145066.1 protocatechuate 3,4-dioxygenase [Novosphingobium sp.]MDR6708987.1 protocatechuate 4,5-dioxygenase beta chain [Novosphingobium sp. 1748]ODU70977.1 MAG: protocatechuate 3,4-dioxygenase [Novosphingobium sp. SCN 66-18]OJX89928.1 MAG: protocatechuate 3,4-dioxygenase [Novosphingobium sp. 63-713]
MAEIVGAYFTSHVPAIGGAIHKGLQQEPYWKPFFDGFHKVHEWLAQVKPDVAIVFNNDHGLNFFLDKMPTFAVGAAAEYHNADEGWGLPIYKPFAGHTELSWHIINSLVEDEFDITTCQKMLVDHALSIPFELAWPDVEAWPVKIVPFAINTVQHPLPSAKRCLALGQAVNKALQSWTGDERIVIIGTGGLSHQLDGERAGFINRDYDTFCMDNLSVDPVALTKDSIHEMVRKAGTQGVEVLNWIAARGALGQAPVQEIHRNYHIPISNTAAATMLMEPA